MRILSFFLFFGIIYAHKDEAYTNQELTELVNDLSNKLETVMNIQNIFGKIDDLQVKIDELKSNLTSEINELKTNLTSQDSRIEVIETNQDDIIKDIETNEANISSNSDDSQALNSTFNNLVIFTAVFEGRNDRLENITFDETETNIGNGMDSSTGIFTAPVSGTYSFSFSVLMSGWILANKSVKIILRVYRNDEFEVDLNNDTDSYIETCYISVWDGTTTCDGWTISEGTVTNYAWTMSLDQGDKIYLDLHCNVLDLIEHGFAHEARFYGQLVMAT